MSTFRGIPQDRKRKRLHSSPTRRESDLRAMLSQAGLPDDEKEYEGIASAADLDKIAERCPRFAEFRKIGNANVCTRVLHDESPISERCSPKPASQMTKKCMKVSRPPQTSTKLRSDVHVSRNSARTSTPVSTLRIPAPSRGQCDLLLFSLRMHIITFPRLRQVALAAILCTALIGPAGGC